MLTAQVDVERLSYDAYIGAMPAQMGPFRELFGQCVKLASVPLIVAE